MEDSICGCTQQFQDHRFEFCDCSFWIWKWGYPKTRAGCPAFLMSPPTFIEHQHWDNRPLAFGYVSITFQNFPVNWPCPFHSVPSNLEVLLHFALCTLTRTYYNVIIHTFLFKFADCFCIVSAYFAFPCEILKIWKIEITCKESPSHILHIQGRVLNARSSPEICLHSWSTMGPWMSQVLGYWQH